MSLSDRALISSSSDQIRIEYYEKSLEARKDSYDCKNNPNGVINLAAAENKLSTPLVASKLDDIPPIPPTELCYCAAEGSERLLIVLAKFLERYITKFPVSPSEIVALNGACSIISNLGTLLCDPGDHIIVCGPGYRGFQLDLHVYSDVGITVAHIDEQWPIVHNVSALQTAYEKATAQGLTVRAIIICSPHNPTGEVLTSGQILEIVSWARTRRIHTIFDELYALSVHDENSKFQSVSQILRGQLGDDVHLVWSLSKDLCVSGLRFGVLYSQNTQLMSVCSSHYALFSSISRLTQWSVIHLLSDYKWLDEFIHENKTRLRRAYQNCIDVLRSLKIPFCPASAGVFVLADFRKFLPFPSADEEMKLWSRMSEAQILLTPSKEMYSKKFGFFRICFAAVNPETVRLMGERLRPLLQFQDSSHG